MNSRITSKPIPPPKSGIPWKRDYFLEVLKTASDIEEYKFAKQIMFMWLATYPGDLEVKYWHATVLYKEGSPTKASDILDEIIQSDPEYIKAIELHALIESKLGKKDVIDTWAELMALDRRGQNQGSATYQKALKNIPQWSDAYWKAKQSVSKGEFEKAEELNQVVMTGRPDTVLTALLHMNLMQARSDTPQAALVSMVQHYQQRFPHCIQFKLILGDIQIKNGDADHGVSMLHQAASQDVNGQVAERLFGKSHRYSNLWEHDQDVIIDISIPRRVGAILGWNQLQKGQPRFEHYGYDPIQEDKSSKVNQSQQDDEKQLYEAPPVTNQFLHIENKSAERSKIGLDNSQPVYVILSLKKNIAKKYGPKNATLLNEAIVRLSDTIQRTGKFSPLFVYADDESRLAPLGIQPVSDNDPRLIKHLIQQISSKLAQKNAHIAILLIVGGPEIVPFHHLPNPTDDSDENVPSDNPYSTNSDNYFIPEWATARLPGESGTDASLLIKSLHNISQRYNKEQKSLRKSSIKDLLALIIRFFNIFKPTQEQSRKSFGYSAQAWRRASIPVYRLIGEPRSLVTSPPTEAKNISPLNLTNIRLGYFNLHGLSDTGEWYGQKDPSEPGDSTEYPVALRPEDVVNGGRAPQIIFTEACFGGHILNKSAEDALSLKFLDSGAQAVIGSTSLSYGSVAVPLNAADLLGQSFYRFLNNGYAAGEALRRAKIYLAKEMHKRQGYLDGEDQKTLISFVLYGDPLSHTKVYQAPTFKIKKSKLDNSLNEFSEIKDIKTICDRAETPGESDPIPKDILIHVKQVVEQYLPGMHGALYTLNDEHAQCSGDGHICPTAQLGVKSHRGDKPSRRVIVLSKDVERASNIHRSYARLTLDNAGKVVKLAVSR